MANILFKKSYQLKTFKPIAYNDLWGKRGVFSTIRILGTKPKYILFSKHLKNINIALKKLDINFLISQKIVFNFFESYNKKNIFYDHLLRIAINSKIISFTLRPRLFLNKNFNAKLFSYQRPKPYLKNLYYVKIIRLLKLINTQKQEIILIDKGVLLEGCTTNILCVRDKKIYIPLKDYYYGTTINYLLSKTKRLVKKIDISVSNLEKYEEIIIVGSGKGVVSLSSIPQIKWKSRSNLIYKELLTCYNKLL